MPSAIFLNLLKGIGVSSIEKKSKSSIGWKGHVRPKDLYFKPNPSGTKNEIFEILSVLAKKLVVHETCCFDRLTNQDEFVFHKLNQKLY